VPDNLTPDNSLLQNLDSSEVPRLNLGKPKPKVQRSTALAKPQPSSPAVTPPPSETLSSLQQQVDAIPETVRVQANLDVDMRDCLDDLLKPHKIKYAEFFMAVTAFLEQHPDAMQQIAADAQQRKSLRHQQMRAKRLLTETSRGFETP